MEADRPGRVLNTGATAPDFELPSTHGDDVRLSDLRGAPVVLYFYPEDHTIGCTMEARRFRDYFEAISLHRAAILGVSRDTLENHCDFRDRNQLPFQLLSDEDGKVHDLYGAWHRPLFGRRHDHKAARRCTYLIGPDGDIAKTYPKVKILSHARTVVTDLERIGHECGWYVHH